jgi:uncharacterized protein (DUF302 family)
MTTREIVVQRFSTVARLAFDEVVARVDAQIGHPDMKEFRKNMSAAQTDAAMRSVVEAIIGSSGLMEFARYDLGEVLRKEQGATARKSLRLVAGNPLIMKEMVKFVADAGSYAPVTILIDERNDGVHLSYDRMASYLAPYGNSEALKVAQDLDAKVETLLKAAAT